MKVGDKVVCIKKPFNYATSLEEGEVYTVAEVSTNIYGAEVLGARKEAIMVEGGCYGAWYIVAGRFELADISWEKIAELNKENET